MKRMEKEGWKGGKRVDYPFHHTQSVLLHPILHCHLPRAGLHLLLPPRNTRMHTQVLLYNAPLHKSKHLCAIWMQPALKFEPCYQSWRIMITNVKIRLKRRFYALSYHSSAGEHPQFWSGCCKMHVLIQCPGSLKSAANISFPIIAVSG